MADMKTEKQKVQEITEKLEQGIKELFESEEYKFSFDTIRNVASELITDIEGRLQNLQKDRVTEQEQDIVLLLSNTGYSQYSLLNVRGMEHAELYNQLSAMNDDDRLSIEAYLERKGAWVTPLADEQTKEVKEYHIDYMYNTDTYEITDMKAMEEMQKKSLEPLRNSDVVVKISSEQGENYEIDKITNMPSEEVRELLNGITTLDQNMQNGNVQEYLKEKGAELTPIMSSRGLNKGGVQFYDFQLDMDKGEVTESTGLSPIKQAENLINRMEHGITRFTGEERDLIVNCNYKLDDMEKTKALAEGIAYQAENKEHIMAEAQAEIDGLSDELEGVSQEQSILEEISEEKPHVTDKVSYYVIEDLSTWAERGTEKSKLERFDSLTEAMEKFSEYRGKDAGDKEDEARATFGFRVNGMEFDLIHVRNNQNCLSLDFTHSKAAQESRRFMEDLQVLSDKIGFDKVRVHREMTPEEVKDFIKQRFEYQIKQGGLEDISLYMDRFDTLYEQGKMEHLLPTANQKHIVEDIPFAEWENPYIDTKYDKGQLDESELAFQIADRFISIQEASGGYDYTIYDMNYRGLDGGIYDNPDISMRKALDEIVQDLKETTHRSQIEGSIQKDDELIPVNYDELMEKVEQAEREQSKEELHTEADGADRLATEIDRFSYEYDTTQYNEVVEDRKAQVENIAADIRSGNTAYLNDFLNAAISEEIRVGITDIFGQGTEIEDSKAVQTARKAKELLDRLAEYKPLAKVEELEEANYNMIDGVLNNGVEKKEEHIKGRISVKEKLAEKKAVIEQRDKPLQEKGAEKKTQREM
ncbi:MAG: DUF4316 domain-containing protein [Lachnospiraceae bacterium]|nr:DUF4316 domain-containing protein [Lachnospiraceae bacterium]